MAIENSSENEEICQHDEDKRSSGFLTINSEWIRDVLYIDECTGGEGFTTADATQYVHLNRHSWNDRLRIFVGHGILLRVNIGVNVRLYKYHLEADTRKMLTEVMKKFQEDCPREIELPKVN